MNQPVFYQSSLPRAGSALLQKINGFYDFIEIGTANFDTLIESVDEGITGISIEPLTCYLDQLPNRNDVVKVNAALSDVDGTADIYYIDQSTIEKYDLPSFIIGSNSINQTHQFTIDII